ncbi:MAG: Ger(x)C family spore germination C-terminal domain-containing protein [Candidatus Neoclostridium sp.]
MNRDKRNLKDKNTRNKITAFAVLIITLIMAMAPGAHGDGDITNKLIAVAMALDYEDGEIKTTIAAAVPKPGSSESSAVIGVPVSGKGKSVAECLSNVERKTGKSLETGLCGVVILGENLAKEGAQVVLSTVLSAGIVSPGAFLAQADGTDGEEIIKKSASLKFDSATALTELMSGASKNTGSKVITLLQFVSDGASVNKTAVAPLVSMQKAQSAGSSGGGEEGGSGGESASFEPCEVEKNALYKGGRLVGKLDEEASRGLSYSDVHTEKGALVCPDFVIGESNVGTVSGEISTVKFANSVSFDGDTPHSSIDVKITLKAADRERVNEVAMRQNLSPDEVNDAYKRNFERLIKNEVEKTLSQSLALDCDVFETEQKLFRFHTKKYKEFTKSGEKITKACRFDVKTEITIL